MTQRNLRICDSRLTVTILNHATLRSLCNIQMLKEYFFNQTTFCIADTQVTNSDFMIERVVQVCFLDFHNIAPSLSNKE